MALTNAISPATPAPLGQTRRATILGSTGSIGVNALDLIAASDGRYTVTALTANSNVALLAEQAHRHQPDFVAVADPNAYGDLKTALGGTGVQIAAGADAICEAASLSSDVVIAGIVGTAGLSPTLEAVRRGATVGLANKECLVSAGDLFIHEVKQHGATLLPVDSEHNAIFQVFDFEHPERVEKIILTASGGPFRDMSRASMMSVTPAEAVAHPNWSMGAKISVDSATMMNKGLELIEAFHLFPVETDQIEIVVHPQSVIHSMVAYVDGSVLAQMGSPDMRIPIGYALSWPDRMGTPAPRLDLAALGNLSFETPDFDRFPALRIARQALDCGGVAPTYLNAANEVAVKAFLDGRVRFLDIAHIVDTVLGQSQNETPVDLDDVMRHDANAREMAEGVVDAL
ncbi:MAG: 1-deoxy-D-xylulose-5-phosphate reductoisomerase [Rhodospirillales bacterium]